MVNDMTKVIETTINSDFTLEGESHEVAFQIAERFIAPALEAINQHGGKDHAVNFMHAMLSANISLLSEFADEQEIDELIKTAKQLTFDQQKPC
mgnify:CR=1 FL=1